jgi:hypothetical protein
MVKIKDYFEINDNKRKCTKCNKIYNISTSGTVLKKHLIKKHNLAVKNQQKITNKEKNEIDETILSFFITSYTSFRNIENKYFKLLIEKLNSNYKLFKRVTLVNKIKKKFEMFKKILKERLEKVQSISISVDIWSNYNYSLLGINSNFFEDNKLGKKIFFLFFIK